jgi:quinolinate synthase
LERKGYWKDYAMSTVTIDSALPFGSYRELGNQELCDRIQKAKQELGSSLLILGHHYQQDEVIEHSDLTGDS